MPSFGFEVHYLQANAVLFFSSYLWPYLLPSCISTSPLIFIPPHPFLIHHLSSVFIETLSLSPSPWPWSRSKVQCRLGTVPEIIKGAYTHFCVCSFDDFVCRTFRTILDHTDAAYLNYFAIPAVNHPLPTTINQSQLCDDDGCHDNFDLSDVKKQSVFHQLHEMKLLIPLQVQVPQLCVVTHTHTHTHTHTDVPTNAKYTTTTENTELLEGCGTSTSSSI